MKLSTSYVEKLQASVACDNGPVPDQLCYEDGEWEARLMRCSRRILSAVVFHEMAQKTLVETDSLLLPIIGYYYTLFHAGIAALCIEHQTSLNELSHRASQANANSPGMTHKKLRRLVSERLVNTGLLDKTFTARLDELKQMREYVNYSVGGRLPGDQAISALEPSDLYGQVGASLDDVTSLIREISEQIVLDQKYEVRGIDRIRVTIGDHFGDDLIQMYVPQESRGIISRALLRHKITT